MRVSYFVGMCARVDVCVCMYVRARAHVSAYVWTRGGVCMCVHVRARAHVSAYVWTRGGVVVSCPYLGSSI